MNHVQWDQDSVQQYNILEQSGKLDNVYIEESAGAQGGRIYKIYNTKWPILMRIFNFITSIFTNNKYYYNDQTNPAAKADFQRLIGSLKLTQPKNAAQVSSAVQNVLPQTVQKLNIVIPTDLSPLEGAISKLEEQAAALENKPSLSEQEKESLSLFKNKIALHQKSLQLYVSKKMGSPDLQIFRLNNKQDFELTSKSQKVILPSHFNETFRPTAPLKLTTTPKFYDYEPTNAEFEDVWVDFANASLGGGCFTHGFVQEEIMVHEMPGLAALIAANPNPGRGCAISTRTGHPGTRESVMGGSPDPILIKGLERVQAISSEKAYGQKLAKLSSEELELAVKPFDVPQIVNLLAIAAPRLPGKSPKDQFHPSTLMDNFNTLMSGFTLVKEQSRNPLIHSGKIGCGVFNNHPHALYLLQCLAAQQLNVQIELHGYTNQEATQFQESWNTIAPRLNGKSFQECMHLISEHLNQKT